MNNKNLIGQLKAPTRVVSSDLLGEIIATLNDSLNWWYPSGTDAGADERGARQRLFEMRDKLESLKRISPNVES